MAPCESDVYALVLGRTIAQLRENRGWTQGDLAAHLSMGQSSLSRFELGQVQPEPFVLEKIADRLGLAPATFTLYVTTAFRRTEAAARAVVPQSKEPWWQEALRVGGLVGITGLATFAVSVTIAEAKVAKAPRRGKAAGKERLS